MSLLDLRMNDYRLDDDLTAVRDLFLDFFNSECPTSKVRAAEPLGFDAGLFSSLATIGVASMGLPAADGGDDASLVALVLLCEQVGAAAAPVPVVQQVIATRLLARAGGPRPIVDAAAAGQVHIALALHPVVDGVRQLLPDGAVATHVIALAGDELVLYAGHQPGAHVANQGSSPLAWWAPGADADKTVLATGAAAAQLHQGGVAEWKLLSAAALVGLTETALRIACEFVRSRETMGVPVGSLQGVAFPLADVAINLDGARNLIRRAAWTHEFDPTARPDLVDAAHAIAIRTATHGTTTSAHMQGGLGFTVEADASLFFLRAKGWGALGVTTDSDFLAIGDRLIAAAAG